MFDATNVSRKLYLLAGATLVVLAMNDAKAAPLYWDANGDGTDSTYGGNGTWDTSNAFWNNSATIGSGVLQTWNTIDNPAISTSAVFLRNTSGAVTVGVGGVMAQNLSFGTSTGSFTTGSGTNYTLSGDAITVTQSGTGTGIGLNNGGTVAIGNAINFSGTMKVVATGGTNSLTLAGGLNNMSASNQILYFEFSSGSNTTDVSGAITRSGNGTIGLVFNGTSSTVVKLSGSNTGLNGNGTLRLEGGILALDNSNALGSASLPTLALGVASSTSSRAQSVLIGTSGVSIGNGISLASLGTGGTATRTLGSAIASGTATFTGGVTLASTGVSLRSDGDALTTFSGLINDGGQIQAVTKIGTGTVALTRPAGNTYDGGTTVSAGTLLVNNTSGSGTGTGGVLVGASGTLGGSGFIDPGAGSTVTVNGKIAPGNGVGTLTVGLIDSKNDVLFGEDAWLVAQVAGDTADTLAVFGSIDLSNSGDVLDVAFTGTQTLSRYVLATYTDGLAGTFSSLNVTGSSEPWQIDYSQSGEIAVVVAVPEPGMLGSLAAAGLLLCRRRRH
ncbi:MAG TPA: autotransporter-associated beta strand repeat-containing protein [Tepidisphaeraceae bacterium]|jgi:hypothetical protein|nr:autotransporter-associated beta strand repeat-containing protein [Tepidisphaeraceae bacterium]